MDNSRREKFISELTKGVKLDEKQRQAFYQKNENGSLNPEIGEIIDGYRDYIFDLGGSFLDITELYNKCLKIAKSSELIGDVKLKARIKDFSSSCTNTNTKMLDDVFGVELVTATEFEKEILMLFNHLLFDIQNDKKYNKETGYIAYHCTGDFSPKEYGNLEERIKRILGQAKTREYKKSRHSDSKSKNISNLVDVFKILPNELSNPKRLKEISKVLEKMLEYAKMNDILEETIPIIEFHFLTAEVDYEATRGRASHSNYKSVNTKLIKEYYNNGRLIRGINAPLKFVATDNGLTMQQFEETLMENWPFLKDDIVRKRNLGKDKEDLEKVGSSDVLTAYQFPFLRKYIESGKKYQEDLKEEKWGILKTLIILNRIDMRKTTLKSLEKKAENDIYHL